MERETQREGEGERDTERDTQRDLLAKKEELRGKWLDWTFTAPSVVGY
jgi:hypothetical protein